MTDTFSSLDKQIAEIADNLRLIAERKSEFVEPQSIPLDLIKNERRQQAQLDSLLERRAKLVAAGDQIDVKNEQSNQQQAPKSPSAPQRLKQVNRQESTSISTLEDLLKEHRKVVVAIIGMVVLLAALFGSVPDLVRSLRPTLASMTPTAVGTATSPLTEAVTGITTNTPKYSPTFTAVPVIQPTQVPEPPAVETQVATSNPTVLATPTSLSRPISSPEPFIQPAEPTVRWVVGVGETLSYIALSLNVDVDILRQLNNLTDRPLQIGQVLRIPTIGTYEVKAGDNLFTIALNLGTSVETLLQLNNLADDRIRVGQVLQVPTIDTYEVKVGDTLVAVAKSLDIDTGVLRELNDLARDKLQVGQVLVVPATGGTYEVQADDTLYSIAIVHNTTVKTLLKLNNLSTNTISIGQVLRVPDIAPTDSGTADRIKDRVVDSLIESYQEMRVALSDIEVEWEKLAAYYCGDDAWDKLERFRGRVERKAGSKVTAIHIYERVDPVDQPVVQDDGTWLIQVIEYWMYQGEDACDEDDILRYKYYLQESSQAEPEFCIREFRVDSPPNPLPATFVDRPQCAVSASDN